MRQSLLTTVPKLVFVWTLGPVTAAACLASGPLVVGTQFIYTQLGELKRVVRLGFLAVCSLWMRSLAVRGY